MDSLPLEILQQIFTLACTDGGYTGCSLALTSKAIREVGHSSRFHSVFLDAFCEQRLWSFLSTYQEQRRPEHGTPPRVRHLYVTLAICSISSDPPVEVAETPAYHLPEGVRTLIQAVAADVRTLVIQAFPGCDTSASRAPNVPALDCTFPFLRELTVFGATDPCSLFSRPITNIHFPQLHRLHIVDTHNMILRLDPWMMHVPGMTHLRVSNLRASRYAFFTKLFAYTSARCREEGGRVEAGRSPDEARPEPSHGSTKTHLRHIILQPSTPQSYNALARQLYRVFCITWGIRRMLAQCPADVGLNVVFLEPPGQPGVPTICARSMRWEWIDRMCGGPGCWRDVEGESGVEEGEDADDGTP